MDKVAWRQKLRQHAQAWNPSEAEVQSFKKNIREVLAKETGLWAGFVEFSGEPPVFETIQTMKNCQWAFPVVNGDEMSFWKVGQAGWVEGAFQIKEPIPMSGMRVTLDQLAGVLVPAMGFSASGHRLGRGKGYYDKTFHKTKMKKIGVAWSHQVDQGIPYEDHDLRVDFLVTEKNITPLARG